MSDQIDKPQEEREDHIYDRRAAQLPLLAAVVAFLILFFPFMDRPWSLPAAILASYSIFVLGLGFGDAKDYLDRTEIRQQVQRLLLIHLFILLIALGVVLGWERAQPLLPEGLTHRYQKGSIWDFGLELTFAIAAVWQGFWMRKIIRRTLNETEE
jgi:Na+/H+ antiporter NhaC